RKDNAVWDMAIVAVLLNVFLQIGCCVGTNHMGDGLSASDPSIWCSIDKTDAAASSQSSDGDAHTADCTDCRQCTGQSAAIVADIDRAALAIVPDDTLTLEPVITPAYSLAIRSYEGRAPPHSLRT
ncbi:MAG: hypothetical protein HWE08_07565, partial [Alphaproteobacteria bacterium]|nr:hypothetical protein [Alphaproteobacteria bacterium]